MKRLSAVSRIEQVLKRIRSASSRSADLAVAEPAEHPLHPLGVVLVHLAPEGGHVEALAHGGRVAAPEGAQGASGAAGGPPAPRSATWSTVVEVGDERVELGLVELVAVVGRHRPVREALLDLGARDRRSRSRDLVGAHAGNHVVEDRADLAVGSGVGERVAAAAARVDEERRRPASTSALAPPAAARCWAAGSLVAGTFRASLPDAGVGIGRLACRVAGLRLLVWMSSACDSFAASWFSARRSACSKRDVCRAPKPVSTTHEAIGTITILSWRGAREVLRSACPGRRDRARAARGSRRLRRAGPCRRRSPRWRGARSVCDDGGHCGRDPTGQRARKRR